MRLLTAIKKAIKKVEETHGVDCSVWVHLKDHTFPYITIYGKDDIAAYCSFTFDDLESKDWVVEIDY